MKKQLYYAFGEKMITLKLTPSSDHESDFFLHICDLLSYRAVNNILSQYNSIAQKLLGD